MSEYGSNTPIDATAAASSLRGGGEPEERLKAAHELREIGLRRRVSLERRGSFKTPAETSLSDDQLAALNSALGDPDEEVRLEAVSSAAELGDASTVDPLTEKLRDERLEISLAAIDSRGEIFGVRC